MQRHAMLLSITVFLCAISAILDATEAHTQWSGTRYRCCCDSCRYLRGSKCIECRNNIRECHCAINKCSCYEVNEDYYEGIDGDTVSSE